MLIALNIYGMLIAIYKFQIFLRMCMFKECS